MPLASKSSAINRSYLSVFLVHNLVSSFPSRATFPSACLMHGKNLRDSASESPVHHPYHFRAMGSTAKRNDAVMTKPSRLLWEDHKDAAISQCILPLSNESHKGSSGRIAVLGGSELYTGAPYFAGMAALRTGADLLSVLTAQEATLPLKCYSPDFMVQSVYNASEMSQTLRRLELSDEMVDTVITHLKEKRIHCCVVGPGLGRHPDVLYAVAGIITEARDLGIYLVLDADALFLLSQPHYRDILKGYDRAVLTPNVVEYQRLMDCNSDSVGDENPFESVTIVQKGLIDTIWLNGQVRYECGELGGMKRCGGIGDVLAGSIGTLVAWQAIRAAAFQREESDPKSLYVNLPLACWTACCLVKRSTQRAFALKMRAMSAQDILEHLGPTMNEMIGE